MLFNVGDYVTRASYNNDTVFKIIDIKDDIAILQGVNIRLIADSNVSDLVFCEKCKEDLETDAVATIICNGDCIGAVAICGKTEEEWKEKSILQLVQTAGSFIGKQLES